MDDFKRILVEIFHEDGVQPGIIVLADNIIPDIIRRSGGRFTKTYINECINELAEQQYVTIEGEGGIGWDFTEKWFAEFG